MTNGHQPAAPTAAPRPPAVRALGVAERAALILVWLGVVDGDDYAVDRALDLLDPEVRAAVLATCELAVRIQPMLRTHEARENALDLLAMYDISFRALTERL